MRVALLLLSLLLPATATASTRVVLYEDGEDIQARVEAAWLTQFGDDIGVRWVGVSAVFPTDEAISVLGDVDLHGCEGEGRTVDDFEAASAAVIDEVTGMNYEGAGVAIEGVTAMLPCLTETPSAEQLGRFHFMRGVVAFYAEGPGKAVERFEEALLVSPFLQWDTRYPPPVKPSFDEAIVSAIAARSAFLSISPRVTSDGTLRIDGVAVDPRTRTRSLYVGTHLLQWTTPDGAATRTWVAELEAGDSLALVERADAVAMLLEGDADDAVTEFTQAQVLAPVERNAGGVLYVANAMDVVAFHSFDPIGSRWRPVDVLALERYTLTGDRMRTAGTVMSVAGGLALGFGAAVATLGRVGASSAHDEVFDPATGQGSRGKLNDALTDYNYLRDFANTGSGVAVVGGALLVGGIPLAIFGNRRAQGAGFHKATRTK